MEIVLGELVNIQLVDYINVSFCCAWCTTMDVLLLIVSDHLSGKFGKLNKLGGIWVHNVRLLQQETVWVFVYWLLINSIRVMGNVDQIVIPRGWSLQQLWVGLLPRQFISRFLHLFILKLIVICKNLRKCLQQNSKEIVC